jgi:WD40-like Beta Propeller Repeat
MAMKLSILERLLKISVMCGFALAGVGINSDVNAFLLTIADPRWGALLGAESIREDLIRLQKKTGLALLTMESGQTLGVDFERRGLINIGDARGTGAISHDGAEVAFSYFSGVLPTHLGISNFDGSDFRQYPNLESPNDICWSHTGTKLAMLSTGSADKLYGLQLWQLQSGITGRISDHGSLSSECWSQNDKQIVYEVDGAINLYDIEKNVSQQLGRGKFPTWSPDGEWIAFLDHDTYYVVRPDGKQKKQLFRRKGASSALWWSPDSRFVAYLAIASMFAGGLAFDVENYRLRVRRLSDNSDDWVADSAGGSEYQWVINPNLPKQKTR